MARTRKQYSLNKVAGLVEQRVNRLTKTTISVYNAAQASLDDNPENPWVTVCETHNSLCFHHSLQLARYHAAVPEWCKSCAEILNPETPDDEHEDL